MRANGDERKRNTEKERARERPLSRRSIHRLIRDGWPVVIASAFATWQNKSIIIVCHWNIVNFHQSHEEETNATTARVETVAKSLLFFWVLFALCRFDDDARCQLTIVCRTETTKRVAHCSQWAKPLRVFELRNIHKTKEWEEMFLTWRWNGEQATTAAQPINSPKTEKESRIACFTSNITRIDRCRRHTCHCPLNIAKQ